VFNPLEVSFEGRICQDFELSSRDAVIEATEQSNVFNVKPIVDGSVEILVSGTYENEVLFDTLRFKSIVLPVEPRFGSIHAGTSTALTMEFGYRALLAYVPNDLVLPGIRCETESYVVRIKRGNDEKEYQMYEALLSEEVKEAFKRLATGDLVTFDQIRYSMNGEIMKDVLPSISVRVK
ncbi:MAG: hypothetical protein ACKO66_03835, partial [Flavobacteriales bacterium]